MDNINKTSVFNLVQSMTGNTNVLVVPKVFLDLMGELQTATFLAQLVYWSGKGHRKDGYIYKTVAEWQSELYMSEYAVRKAKATLEEMNIITTKVVKANGNPTVHYKVNVETLVEMILQKQNSVTLDKENGYCVSEVSITEHTPELTDTSYEKDLYINNNRSIGEIRNQTEDIIEDMSLDDNEEENKSSSDRELVDNYYLSMVKDLDKDELKTAKSLIMTYYARYIRMFGRAHSRIATKQVKRVVETFASFMAAHSLDRDCMVEIIDLHFRSSLKTDYNINHFATYGALRLHALQLGYATREIY